MALEHADGTAVRGQFGRDREAGDAGPDDRDVDVCGYWTTTCRTFMLLNVCVTELWLATASV